MPTSGALSFIDFFTRLGPIWIFGWSSLGLIIIIGFLLLCTPPRSDRRVSLVNIYAACLHIQVLIFILCVPLLLLVVPYMTLDPLPTVVVRDMLVAAVSVLLNSTIAGVFLVSVSLRHRTAPTIEWPPIVSVLISIISVFAVWELRVAAGHILKTQAERHSDSGQQRSLSSMESFLAARYR
jgi:hypothetical protein